MKIALDVQSLFEEKKTGIGWTVKMMTENLLKDKRNDFYLNYFSFRNHAEKQKRLACYQQDNTTIACCKWMPLGIYRRIWKWLPLPYSMFFQESPDITQFFNYVIPPGAKGIKSVYIYDMVYKACPETMEAATRAYMEKEMERSCRRADLIITISEFSKNEIIKYMNVDPDKIAVVPCGIDHAVFHDKIKEEAVKQVKEIYHLGEQYFLYLGTLEPRKNIPLIIRAYHELYKRNGSSIPKLVLVGKRGWGYDEIFALIQELELQNMVLFPGYVSEADKPAMLRGAVCFLFPSLYEGFGIPPLEAMACGTPVIVSDAASLPEVVGEGGIQVSYDDYEAMSSYMERLSMDDEYREQWSKSGVEQAARFSWERSAEILADAYQVHLKEMKSNKR